VRKVWIAGGVGAVALLAVVLIWFQPQTLLFDTEVDEDLPDADLPVLGGEGRQPPTPAGSPMAEEAVLLREGRFSSRSRYAVEGRAAVYEVGGEPLIRLEGFSSTNGPDLYVYLTAADSDADDSALAEDYVNLGVLKGNVGNQNYEVPGGVDLDRFNTVVIWCRRFAVGFGAADLS
jgi:hypothetical protein